MKPLFIFSLPRAGSTLLQRILSSHAEIATAPEPWIALPIFFALRPGEVDAVYDHSRSSQAIAGLASEMPNGISDYREKAASFLMAIYRASSASEAQYFLDKTPRYHLIVEELIEAFPEGKFIFLWRNPLAIASSMIETWSAGKWNLHLFSIDLYRGVDNLTNAYTKYKDRVVSMNYEEIVTSPVSCISMLSAYLDLPGLDSVAKELNNLKTIDAPGRGDPTGQYKYGNISQGSLDGWGKTFSNPLRKRWAKNYLNWIGNRKLEVMGYSLSDMQAQLASIPIRPTNLMSDVLRRIYGQRLLLNSTKLRESRYRNIKFPKR